MARCRRAGLTVMGVPSQDFNQESGSNAEVKQFCEATFGVDFPMAGMSHVRGEQAHPFYGWVRAELGWEPELEFQQGADRSRRADNAERSVSSDEPYGPRLQAAIAAQLAATS